MQTLLDIIKSETLDPPARVTEVMSIIQARHAGRVQAMVYYGSSLRELDNPEKMLDFYVLVDSYRKTHGTGLRALLNRLIPPAVYYVEHTSPDGTVSTCKYSILSLSEFEKRCSSRAFLSQVWGRFSQPCAVLWSKDQAVLDRVWAARVTAVETMVNETAPLMAGSASAPELWGRGFYESYQTELRPESSTGRSEEIVARFADRYGAITAALYGQADKEGRFALPIDGQSRAKRRWFFRRLLGKPAAAIRVLNGAATFDGGIDYIARKVENHSGVKLDPTPAQRKHPVLHSPFLFWKMWRKGAFR
ncbi:hypothetical protein GCM10011309_07670 [Litorimonas cladophorae]|uniref:Phosphatidate cytidylyltransferase n=1 Tax=Litorimonas cladophorae TaxID=1220491 RepID=A0A918NCL0_9PROT|nr:hypothetical protein [Litorimonas cladophorae]GGX60293.1 hypothetical protein GCM10011309_07670 [Litorimonas cladophorae]